MITWRTIESGQSSIQFLKYNKVISNLKKSWERFDKRFGENAGVQREILRHLKDISEVSPRHCKNNLRIRLQDT